MHDDLKSRVRNARTFAEMQAVMVDIIDLVAEPVPPLAVPSPEPDPEPDPEA